MKASRVVTYFNLRGSLSRAKPKGCKDPSKGTKLKYKGAPDIRIRNCETKTKKRKTTKKKGKGKKK